MLNVVIFGAPGSGKGTQSIHLKDKYGLIHISTGDLLRAEMAAKTDLGKMAENYIVEGQLVPDEVVIGMLEDTIKKNPEAKGFIFDGFPRTLAQGEALDEILKKFGQEISLSLIHIFTRIITLVNYWLNFKVNYKNRIDYSISSVVYVFDFTTVFIIVNNSACFIV